VLGLKKKRLDLIACKELKAREEIEELKKIFFLYFFKYQFWLLLFFFAYFDLELKIYFELLFMWLYRSEKHVLLFFHARFHKKKKTNFII